MDLWQLIKNDHDNVEQLFQQIMREGGGDLREKLFRQLKQELTLHTKVEEDIFYPALKQHEETRTFLADAQHEHDEAKRMLQELDGAGSKDSEDWAQKLSKLRVMVQHHVTDEEEKIFPAAQKVIDPAQAEELKRQIEREKSQGIQQQLV